MLLGILLDFTLASFDPGDCEMIQCTASPYPWNQQLTPEASIKGDQSSTIFLGVCPKHIF